MPADTRKTVRRNFSISEEASDEIDEYAAENNLSKSKVVENAVLEFCDGGRDARIESKVDRILDHIQEGEGTPSPASEEKKRENSAGENPASEGGYDPTDEREEPLSTDELRAITSQDGAMVNGDHIDTFPRDTTAKVDVLEAIARHEHADPDRAHPDTIHEGAAVGVVKEYVGGTDHLLNTVGYPEKLLERFEPLQRVDDGEVVESPLYAVTERGRRAWYENRVDFAQEFAETDPMEYEYDQFSISSQKNTLEELRKFSEIITNLGILSEEELTDLRDRVDESLTELREVRSSVQAAQSSTYDRVSRDEVLSESPLSDERTKAILDGMVEWGTISESEKGLRVRT